MSTHIRRSRHVTATIKTFAKVWIALLVLTGDRGLPGLQAGRRR